MGAVNLTSGAISKIVTGKCTENDFKPVLRVTFTDRHGVELTDGCSTHFGCISDDIFMSNKLQKGDIVQLTNFHFTKYNGNIRVLIINDLNLIHNKSDIIVNPEPFPCIDIPIVERSTPPIPCEDHVDVSHAQESMTSTQQSSETQSRKRKHQPSNETPESDNGEDVDNSHIEQEPLATTEKCSPSLALSSKRKCQSSDDNISTQSRKTKHQSSNETPDSDTNEDVGNSHIKQEPLTTTQKCSPPSLTLSNKRKRQSSDDNISKVVEDVSKRTKLMMEKNRTLDVGFKKLQALEEDVSRMTKMMIKKNKEDDVGACYKKLEILEDDVGACFKKLEVLEEGVSKLTRMMMEKYKEDDMGACIEKLDEIGWVAQDPMYNTALLLFGQSADYRRLWLHLKPESCGNWVKNAGSMFGLLD